MKINIINVLKSLTDAQRIISPAIGTHQQQVAYLAYRIAGELNMSRGQKFSILTAGLLHDIGALSLHEKEGILNDNAVDINTHAFRGAYLVSKFLPGRKIANIIKYHHFPWKYGETLKDNPDMPLESQLIHLADRICAYITTPTFVLSQVPQVEMYTKRLAGSIFMEDHVKAFLSISKQESMWLDLISSDPIEMVDHSYFSDIEVSIDDLVDLSLIFSYLVDFRSPFTSTHSASVGRVAEALAELMHFSSTDCKKMLIAGYLHDIGKLTIDNSILEKQSTLEPHEFDIIRSHTYYTYHLLDNIEAFDEIKCWGAFHHERLNGEGYPFHIGEQDLSLGSRIMAVADVFSALQEKRPYKDAMKKDEILSVLSNMVKNNSLDESVVAKVSDNFQRLYDVCTKAKALARKEYSQLYSIGVSQHQVNSGE